ncbi:MAG: hypothetical protein V5A22_09995 [Salinivenus sp.]
MSSDFKEKVLDAIRTSIEEAHQRAQALEGTHSLSAEELFPPSFMQENTSFDRVEAFLVEGGFDPERDGDWDDLADEGLDQHVRDTTDFDAWAEMKDAAAEEWARRQLTS